MTPKIIPQRHNLRRHLEHYGKIIPVWWAWVIVFVTNDIFRSVCRKTWALKSIGTFPRAPSSFSGSFLGGCQWQFEVDTEVFDVENPQRLQSSPWSVASPPRRSESAPPHPSGATGTSSFHWIIKTAPILTRTSLASNPILTSGHISKPPRPVVRFFFRG